MRSGQIQLVQCVGLEVRQPGRLDGRRPAPRSTIVATATTSAPASRTASTAVSGEPPVVEVSSTDQHAAAPTPGPRSGAACRAPSAPCGRRRRRAAARARRRRAAWRWPPGRRPASARRPRRSPGRRSASSITCPTSGAACAVQGDPAQVDVPVGLEPRGERHLAVHHGLVLDLLQQLSRVRQSWP